MGLFNWWVPRTRQKEHPELGLMTFDGQFSRWRLEEFQPLFGERIEVELPGDEFGPSDSAFVTLHRIRDNPDSVIAALKPKVVEFHHDYLQETGVEPLSDDKVCTSLRVMHLFVDADGTFQLSLEFEWLLNDGDESVTAWVENWTKVWINYDH